MEECRSVVRADSTMARTRRIQDLGRTIVACRKCLAREATDRSRCPTKARRSISSDEILERNL
jgi:hypothetical protein